MRHLSEALDKVLKTEYARLSGKDRRFIKGQKYTLLSNRENLATKGRKALKTLKAANKRLNTAYLLKESFSQLWDYKSEAWARSFFEQWRDAQMATTQTFRNICRHDRPSLGRQCRLL